MLGGFKHPQGTDVVNPAGAGHRQVLHVLQSHACDIEDRHLDDIRLLDQDVILDGVPLGVDIREPFEGRLCGCLLEEEVRVVHSTR